MVPADSRGISRVPRYSGYHHANARFAYAAITLYGAAFQRLPLAGPSRLSWSYYPGDASTTPVWAPPLSLATTRGITLVLFSCGYLDVSVPRVRLPLRDVGLTPDGLPHSETRGSTGICPFPRTIAAYRVLRRLREPRHPPSALSHFPFLSRLSTKEQAGRSSRRRASRRPPAFITSLVVFQHVKDPFRPPRDGTWRITDSNR